MTTYLNVQAEYDGSFALYLKTWKDDLGALGGGGTASPSGIPKPDGTGFILRRFTSSLLQSLDFPPPGASTIFLKMAGRYVVGGKGQNAYAEIQLTPNAALLVIKAADKVTMLYDSGGWIGLSSGNFKITQSSPAA